MLHLVQRTRRGRNVRFGLLARVRDSDLGDAVRIGSGSIVIASTIGAFSYAGHHCTLLHVTIGRFCSISWQVSILGHGAHPMDRLSTHQFPYNPLFGFTANDGTDVERRDTTVGSDCWIGAGATILPGVRVGDGCVIGAGSIVTRDLEDFSIVVGSPARLVRRRFDEPTRALLREIRWWDWPADRVRRHLPLFESAPTDFGVFREALRAAAGGDADAALSPG
jgi:acetyltransferase-like isoleucine patch superfamily enzyme